MDLGFFPLQDFSTDKNAAPVALRHCIAGGRIERLETSPASGKDGLIQYGKEHGHGTLGDIHPWSFWQTRDKGVRGMGSWSMGWGGLITEADGDYAIHSVQPLRKGRLEADTRYVAKSPGAPRCSPAPAKGQTVLVVPGTEESRQADFIVPADGRLVAPHVTGSGMAGTLICDLQPGNELCMAGSVIPGVGGRHARLQSLVRVIPVPKGGIKYVSSRENILALNHALSGVEGMAGLGAVWARLTGSTGGPGTGGGGSGGTTTPGSQGSQTGELDLGGDPKKPEDYGTFEPRQEPGHGIALMAHNGAMGPMHPGGVDDVHQVGKDADGHPINSGHIAANAYFYHSADRDGPLTFEGTYPAVSRFPVASPVHLSWDDKDSHPWLSGSRPGRWKWWAEVPYKGGGGGGGGEPGEPGGPTTPGGGGGGPGTPPTIPGVPSTPTDPPGSGSPGGGMGGGGGSRRPRFGQNRRTTSPRGGIGPGDPGLKPEPPDPRTAIPLPGFIQEEGRYRRRPTPYEPKEPPNKGGPWPGVKPGTGIPEPTQPEEPVPPDWPPLTIDPGGYSMSYYQDPGEGIPGSVGDITPDFVGAYSIIHPMQEGFAALSFRPQLWYDGAINYEHNPKVGAEHYDWESRMRPQVLACRAWGAQTDGGEWDYETNPNRARPQGGDALGGILFSPPGYEMEDYFSIRSVQDVKANTGTDRFVTIAPGVGLSFGIPETDGGVAQRSVVLKQVPSGTDSDEPFVISQVDSSGVQQELAKFAYNQTGSSVSITLGGTVTIAGSASISSVDLSTITIDGSSLVSDTITIEDGGGTIHEMEFDNGMLLNYTAS
jgi:hypothetical protein